MTSPPFRLSLSDLKAASERIRPHVHLTPVLTSSALDELSGRKLFFKCENMQKTGSFKPRGATNAIIKAKESNPTLSGFVTHSSGNHGQAVAWASGKVAGLPGTVVVPRGTPEAKCRGIRGYGAKLVFCEPTPLARSQTCSEIAADTGATVIHPYDNYDTITGQATVAYELHQQVPDLDAVLVPVSGGGLASGTALATLAMKGKDCTKVIGVEPEGKELGPCLKAGARLWSDPPVFLATAAEGIRTQQLGHLTFPIVCDLVEQDVITVSDSEMFAAMRLLAERMKLVVEASAGAALAGALKLHQHESYASLERVGVVLTGGNLDLDRLPWASGKDTTANVDK